MKRGIIINTSNNTIERDCLYNPTRVDGMYYKVDSGDLIPVAYIYPEETREQILALLNELRAAKKLYDDTVARIYYTEFPKFRG